MFVTEKPPTAEFATFSAASPFVPVVILGVEREAAACHEVVLDEDIGRTLLAVPNGNRTGCTRGHVVGVMANHAMSRTFGLISVNMPIRRVGRQIVKVAVCNREVVAGLGTPVPCAQLNMPSFTP